MVGRDDGAGHLADAGAVHAGVFPGGFWRYKPERGQHLRCVGSSQRQGGPIPANVCQLYIVHYYEVVEMAYQRRNLVITCIQQQIAGAPVYVAITLDTPLHAQQETVISLSFRE